ncbi:MAG: hypothetical protein IPH12_03900 [Saprospirales bacterium]|nr:hypothetical protein [Saprospirales bacterium]MBK8922585.1 hypothetical protein [Saprospirales bacterium]
MPTVQRNDRDNTSAIITVTLTREDLKPKIDAELKRFRQRAAIKGFRQGQAPAEHIKRMFGASIFSETLQGMLSDELLNYLRDSELDVLGQPLPSENQKRYSFKIDQMEDEYVVEYEVGFVPPFTIRGLDKGQTFERLTISNLDELAEKDLEYARRRMGKRSNPESDIQEKDILKIAARELEEDQPKPDGWETTITVLVESVSDEGLKNTLLGLKKGDPVRFNARLLEWGNDEAKFRKYILNLPEDDARSVGDWFEGAIEEVLRVEIAELDEEFYSNYFGGGVDSREEALEQLKKNISGYYDVRSNALLMREFQARLMELNQMDLPDQFLKRWLGYNNAGMPPDQIEAEYPAFAENLRWSLLRDRLKAQFALEVTDAELRAEYARKVRNYFQAELPDHLIESSVERLMQDQKDVENTRKDLESSKTFQAIRAEVTVVDKAIPSEEFHKILDALTKKAEAEQESDAALRESVEE